MFRVSGQGPQKNVEVFDLANHQAVSSQPPESAYKLFKQAYSRDVDAVVFNNSNLRTLEVIERFEGDFGKPVVAANQALMWMCLRTLGVQDSQKIGRLFQL